MIEIVDIFPSDDGDRGFVVFVEDGRAYGAEFSYLGGESWPTVIGHDSSGARIALDDEHAELVATALSDDTTYPYLND